MGLLKTKPQSKYLRVLHALKERGSMTNGELNRITCRYSARIAELRHDGHDILTERVSPGLFRYTYMGHQDDKAVG